MKNSMKARVSLSLFILDSLNPLSKGFPKEEAFKALDRLADEILNKDTHFINLTNWGE